MGNYFFDRSCEGGFTAVLRGRVIDQGSLMAGILNTHNVVGFGGGSSNAVAKVRFRVQLGTANRAYRKRVDE